MTRTMSAHVSHPTPEFEGQFLSSAQTLRTLRLGGQFVEAVDFTAETQRSPRRRRDLLAAGLSGIKRRFRRERRRRKVGRA
ncbi:MAG TPA: hypothetical protein VGW32_10230, partial [Pyrinomonadaceae bacterium]|nr:hypothetical protein [Pyrinomonadaceae bacterium]